MGVAGSCALVLEQSVSRFFRDGAANGHSIGLGGLQSVVKKRPQQIAEALAISSVDQRGGFLSNPVSKDALLRGDFPVVGTEFQEQESNSRDQGCQRDEQQADIDIGRGVTTLRTSWWHCHPS